MHPHAMGFVCGAARRQVQRRWVTTTSQVGLMLALHRTADVRTVGACEVLELHADDLWQVTRPPGGQRQS